MPGTTGIINGTLMRLYKDGTAIGAATTCAMTVGRELRETIHKDNPGSGWREVAVGQKTATLTTEALYSLDTANVAPGTLFDALDNGTLMLFKFTTDVSGDDYYQGSAYCTQFDINAVVEENTTYSCTFEITGAVTRSTETS